MKSVKAWVRGGRAQLGLQQSQAAADMFKQALQLDAGNRAAQVCLPLLCLCHIAATPFMPMLCCWRIGLDHPDMWWVLVQLKHTL